MLTVVCTRAQAPHIGCANGNTGCQQSAKQSPAEPDQVKKRSRQANSDELMGRQATAFAECAVQGSHKGPATEIDTTLQRTPAEP